MRVRRLTLILSMPGTLARYRASVVEKGRLDEKADDGDDRTADAMGVSLLDRAAKEVGDKVAVRASR